MPEQLRKIVRTFERICLNIRKKMLKRVVKIARTFDTNFSNIHRTFEKNCLNARKKMLKYSKKNLRTKFSIFSSALKLI